MKKRTKRRALVFLIGTIAWLSVVALSAWAILYGIIYSMGPAEAPAVQNIPTLSLFGGLFALWGSTAYYCDLLDIIFPPKEK